MAYAQLHPDPDESSDAIWNELSEALIHVREEMADAGTSYEEAEGRAASILKGLGFRYQALTDKTGPPVPADKSSGSLLCHTAPT